jgi:methyltransferase family protein
VSDFRAAISPVSFWRPDYICPSAWIEHAPFAFWLCEALRPRCFVELGTHYGYSYFAFCQSIDRLGLGTTAYAVDTWKGDEHAGFYDESVFSSVALQNAEKYATFSVLLRSTFDDALGYFADGSVDLLHIDGRHLYDDVAHDFATWLPKLTDDAVVLFHDTNVRERGFGVWKFFDETAAQHPSFQFVHGHGLGVLIPGDRIPAPLAPLFKSSSETADQIRATYAALGAALEARKDVAGLRAALADRDREIAGLRGALDDRDREIAAYNAEHRIALDAVIRGRNSGSLQSAPDPSRFKRPTLGAAPVLANGGHGAHADYGDA